MSEEDRPTLCNGPSPLKFPKFNLLWFVELDSPRPKVGPGVNGADKLLLFPTGMLKFSRKFLFLFFRRVEFVLVSPHFPMFFGGEVAEIDSKLIDFLILQESVVTLRCGAA